MRLIGHREHEWILLSLDRDESDWISLILIGPGSRNKTKKYWLGWNGERLSHSTDAGLLHKRHPEIENWVIGLLQREWAE